MSVEVRVGDKLGPFRLTGILGSGGAGKVYQAEHEETGELKALKTLMAGTAINEEIHNRFVREISVAQKLQHPNVVAYDDCGLHDDILYYTMELVPWGALSEVLAHKSRLEWRDAVEAAIHICDGLQHLHDANIVHRDLKPANIFLSDDGRLKLGDFGLARDLNSSRLTIEGQTVGTAKYLAPEQAMAKTEIDGRTDVYALGCILYEMLAGRPPFVNDDPYSPSSYVQLMRQHVEETPPSLTDFCPDCPPVLVSLVDQMLRKVPDERPAAAEEVSKRLASILEDPAQAPSDSFEPKQDAAESAVEKSLTERLHESTVEERKVNPAVLIGLAVAIIAIIGIAMFANK